MKNIRELRNELAESYDKLKKGELGINEVKARVSICNTVISSIKTEMERFKMVGEPKKHIDWTDDK